MDNLVTEPEEDFKGETNYEQRIIRIFKVSGKQYLTTQELEQILGKYPIEILSQIGIIYEKEPGKWYLNPSIAHLYIKPQSQPQPQQKPQNQNYQGYYKRNNYYKYNKYNYYRKYNYDYKFKTAYDLKKEKTK